MRSCNGTCGKRFWSLCLGEKFWSARMKWKFLCGAMLYHDLFVYQYLSIWNLAFILSCYSKRWYKNAASSLSTHHLNSRPPRKNTENSVSTNRRPSKKARYHSFLLNVTWTTHQTDTIMWLANINLVSTALTISEMEDMDRFACHFQWSCSLSCNVEWNFRYLTATANA